MERLYIPEKLKVGFQKRSDTYTGNLAYVIYFDLKGVLRKEKSWQTWRSKEIEPQDFDNVPTEGFVLNKKVGGYKSHWNFRDAHVRVYDPRGFEFEISVPNLLFVLTQCDCYRGKGLEGKFVYAWQGTELVLLPERSEEFQSSKKYTSLQVKQVKAKELVPGASYLTKKQELLTFIGKFDYFDVIQDDYYGKPKLPDSKKFVFWDGKQLTFLKDVKSIAATAEAESTPDLAELTQKYYLGPHGSRIAELFTKEIPENERTRKYWYDSFSQCQESKPGTWNLFRYGYKTQSSELVPSDYGQVNFLEIYGDISLENGLLHIHRNHRWYRIYRSSEDRRRHYDSSTEKWIEPTYRTLWARLESGSEFKVCSGGLENG